MNRPERLSRTRVRVVDPIDGTRSYIAGYREFAVSVALAEDGEAVVGVVYNRPAARFSGRRGTGRLPRGGLVGRHCPEPHVHGVLAAAPGLFAPLLERVRSLPSDRLRPWTAEDEH